MQWRGTRRQAKESVLVRVKLVQSVPVRLRLAQWSVLAQVQEPRMVGLRRPHPPTRTARSKP